MEPFNAASEKLIELYAARRYPMVWNWCAEKVRNASTDSFRAHLSHALLSRDSRSAEQTDALAAAYFTYYILLG